MLLDSIQKANDIKNLKPENYEALAAEIRAFLIDKISMTGGHVGSNLGVVELTMALHLCLDLPKDKIVWDVGHQAYTHKLLTGRREGFDTLRKFHGMSGFPKRKESDCDCFDTGHSSTSISAGLGLVKARDLRGTNETIVAVIGDGSFTGGMAYEALNNAARLHSNYIIVLNDNEMSISENVGGMHKYLNRIRTGDKYLGLKSRVSNALMKALPEKGESVVDGIRHVKNAIKHFVIPGTWFEELGVTYLGPVDGHDTETLIRVLEEAKRVKGAVVVHVLTKKGKGYTPAELDPSRFHGIEPFHPASGALKEAKRCESYTKVFSDALLNVAAENKRVVAITAAMPDGTGLTAFHDVYPDRFFDVGIAEQHAVTFAAGLAAGGLIPVVAVYSSFLQRAYDQILHDVCLQNLPVVFAIDRAGLVGSDGETHQGVFDYSYLGHIPNMHIMAPKNQWELGEMLKFAVALQKPVGLRYPRGAAYCGLTEFQAPIEYGKSELLYEGSQAALFAVGSMVEIAVEVRTLLLQQGVSVTVVNGRFIKPIDEEAVRKACATHRLIVTLEDNAAIGGYGQRVAAFMEAAKLHNELYAVAVPDRFIEHGSVELLRQELHIDAPAIAKGILERIV